MKKVDKGKNGGHAYVSDNGRFYIGWCGEIYSFHLELGHLMIAVESKMIRRRKH